MQHLQFEGKQIEASKVAMQSLANERKETFPKPNDYQGKEKDLEKALKYIVSC